MAEKPTQYGSVEEIEQDAFLLAELNYREAYTLDPIGALEQWYEFVTESRIRGVTGQEVTEMSWHADNSANTFDLNKELTNVE